MEEASKVRLVRCPKCENLLPELPDFSLYKCGGCGAVLKAKKKGIQEDILPNISYNVEGGVISEKSSTVKDTKVDVESADGIEEGKVERINNEEFVSNGCSTSPATHKVLPSNSDTTRRGKERVTSVDSFDDECRAYPQGLPCNRNRGKSCDFNVYEPEFVNFHDENINGIPPMDSSRARPVRDVKSKGSILGHGSGVSVQVSYDDFLYHDEGQSSYGMNRYYEQGERVRYQNHNLHEPHKFENLENGRAELLRKLDELKDRISRSCDMENKPNEKIGIDPYGRVANYAQEGINSSQAAMGPPYFSRSSGYAPYADRYGRPGLDPYPQSGYGYPHEYLHYANSYKPEALRRPPPQLQSQYSNYYGDANHGQFMLHRHENFFHQPACSCVHCCDNDCPMPPRVDPPGFHNRRPQIGLNLYPSNSRQSLTLNSKDLDSDNDGFNYHRPRKMVVARASGRVSHPIGGGAPFITCSNCFEVLKLPRKHFSCDENQHKLKCGACSSILLFEVGSKGFAASVSTLVEDLPTEIDEVSGGTVDNARYWNDGSSNANLNTFSNDFDDKKPNSGEVEKQLNHLSSNSSPSEEEENSGNKSSRKHDSPIPNLPASPSENTIISQYDKWNKSRRTEEERFSLDRDGVMASETDVSLNAFSNSNRSHDSTDASREAPKASKGGESFFAGLIKKSLRDFRKPKQGVEVGGSQVFVNGHLIQDRVVKKAEKLAGPIQPGEYWYDKQAGFWGVMGYPCLGIIMPNIEEFNYPIPKNCGAGNTGVYVNGRELHEKDLNLLGSRGLPITENRSYIVDITGKVVDEQTGEELDGLGKLAPTVERSKHGFGMKVPRFIAQSKS